MPVGAGGKPATPPAGAGGFKPGGGAAAQKPATPPSEPPAGAEPKKGNKGLLIVIILLLVLVLAGGGGFAVWFFLFRTPAEPVPVVETPATEKPLGSATLSSGDSISINLADGHYMRFAATVYFDSEIESGGSGENAAPVDPSPLRDAAIAVFRNQDYDKVCLENSAIEESKEKIIAKLNELPFEGWHNHVVRIDYTDFACQ